MSLIYLRLLLLLLLIGGAHTASSISSLSANFYKASCPETIPKIASIIQEVVRMEQRMGASLLRLHFHDCFVGGCDASILLDDRNKFKREKNALPNMNSVRGYHIIERVKAEMETLCPGVVSCADIVALVKATMSAQDTTPGHNVSISDLAPSIM